MASTSPVPRAKPISVEGTCESATPASLGRSLSVQRTRGRPQPSTYTGPTTDARPPALSASSPEPRSTRWFEALLRDPCCGGVLLVLPVLGLVTLVRWTVSSGSVWGIGGLAAVGAAAIGLVLFARKRRARRRLRCGI
jgi:hypothetical protein